MHGILLAMQPRKQCILIVLIMVLILVESMILILSHVHSKVTPFFTVEMRGECCGEHPGGDSLGNAAVIQQ